MKFMGDQPPAWFRAESEAGGVIALSWEWLAGDPEEWESYANWFVEIHRSPRGFPGGVIRGPVDTENPIPAGQSEVVFDSRLFLQEVGGRLREHTHEARQGDLHVRSLYQFLDGDRLVRTITVSQSTLPEDPPAPTRVRVRVLDRPPVERTAGRGYWYYTLCWFKAGFQAHTRFARHTRAAAPVLGPGGHDLFKMLPLIHQDLDRTLPPEGVPIDAGERGKGQLARLLGVFSAQADTLLARSQALCDLPDPERTDPRALPLLAQQLGWQLDPAQELDAQRQELRALPEIYREIGTGRLLVALVRRWTGWNVTVRELARNVLFSLDTRRFVVVGEGAARRRLYADGWLAAAVDGGAVAWSGNALPGGALPVPVGSAERVMRTLDTRRPSKAAEALWFRMQGPRGAPPTGPGIVILQLPAPTVETPDVIRRKWQAVWPRLLQIVPAHVTPFLVVEAQPT